MASHTIFVSLYHPELFPTPAMTGILKAAEGLPDLQIRFIRPFEITRILDTPNAGLVIEAATPDGPPEYMGRMPVIGIKHPVRLGTLPRVIEDPKAVARRVLQHFKDESLANVAAFHSEDPANAEGRQRYSALRELLEAEGAPCHAFPGGPRCREAWSLEGQIGDLADWVNSLPLPCGILCGDDEHAHRLYQAIDQTRLRVPDDLAILGYGDHQLFCQSLWPALSSIAANRELLGRECLLRLRREIQGTPDKELVTWLDSARVVKRESTDRRFQEFPLVKRSLQLLEKDLPAIDSVQTLTDLLNVSATTLNTQFRNATGLSTWAWIKQRRLDHAIHLLKSTRMTLAEICAETGCQSISQLSADIRKLTGKTPRDIRKEARKH